MLVRIFERRFTLRLLSESQHPVNFKTSEGDFFDDLMLLVALSSQMEFAALRELSSDGLLTCLGLWGFGDNPDREQWDISSLGDGNSDFAAALTSHRPVPVYHMTHGGHRALLEKTLEADSGKRLTNYSAQFDELEGDLLSVTDALDKMKSATRPPAREFAVHSLLSIWEEARSQIIGRLNQLHIERCNYDGPDVSVRVARDWFRQVFLNLLLNSADAFALQKGHHRNKRITLQVDRGSEKSGIVTLAYSDNAGGINPASLRGTDGRDLNNIPVERAIFLPYVTSKPGGSGWGLSLAARILTEHKGSINLADYRNGVTFRIELPRVDEGGA